MKSQKRGKNTLPEVEVQNISTDGIFLFVGGEEYFLSYTEYPWFKNATVSQVHNVELTEGGTGLNWPDLDVDLELESLKSPEKYPLKYRA